MGRSQSKGAPPAEMPPSSSNDAPAVNSATPPPPDPAPTEGGGGGCPMKRGGGGGGFGAMFGMKNPHLPGIDGKPGLPTEPQQQQFQNEPSAGGCPVKGGKSNQGTQYNVYSQPIDPTNQMPAVANQLPSPGQTESLSTDRIKSTIPKGGAEEGTTWTYPSPQMFYNSLARKNKLGDTTEEDIAPVVALHNNMNEKTWAAVLEWEAVLNPAGENADDGRGNEGPKLLKFLGRPSDLSPKARFKNWVLGHPLPFDRHDWTLIRPDGTEVRYVIDYYHDESRAKETEGSGMPDMHDREAVESILVDVRPAMEGPSAAVGRMAIMPYARRIAKSTPFTPLPMAPTSAMKEQVGESIKVWESIQENARSSKAAAKGEENKAKVITVARGEGGEEAHAADVKISAKEATELAKSFASALKDCQEAQRALDACKDDAECARASLALTMCMGKILCPLQHSALAKSLAAEPSADAMSEAEYNARVDAALENIAVCVAASNEKAAIAKKVQPEAFAKGNTGR